MIIGIITLITALLFGGPEEIFYVDNIDKGVEKFVIDKERKKNILTELKVTEKVIKEFNKKRKKDAKILNELYANPYTNNDQLNSFFVDLQKSVTSFQIQIVNQRLVIFEKIEPQEWDEIVKTSKTASENRNNKLEKKGFKSKKPYFKTEETIKNTINSTSNKINLLIGLKKIADTSKELENEMLSLNTSKNTILANKDTSKEELREILMAESQKRRPLIISFIKFHQIAKENCTEIEFDIIIKSLLKEANISNY